MTTQTAISWIHRFALACSLATGAALAAMLVFSLQASRAKKEHHDYDSRVVLPERQKWQSAVKAPDVGGKIEPLPSIPVELFAEETRLATESARLTFRRDMALNASVTAGILSALMFGYHSALKKRAPIQPPQTTRAFGPRV